MATRKKTSCQTTFSSLPNKPSDSDDDAALLLIGASPATAAVGPSAIPQSFMHYSIYASKVDQRMNALLSLPAALTLTLPVEHHSFAL
jgi:hypothetical protein